MSGDETINDESTNPPMRQEPVTAVQKSVFSDDFDDPDNRRDLDELPDDEPLTPELVEEEAIRGDFMLRWAIVFLAVLLAFGQINTTKPLVLIRSGDQMRANGFLPIRVDQFSHTAEGTSVTNVSWLFDHIVSLSWLVGGEKGLTLLKVLLAAVSAWLLVRISVAGVSTWWSSICAIFAVIACSSDYWPLPELMTILGMTLTMLLLFQHRQGQASGLHWKLPLLIAVWCNLDSHAWVGAGVIVAYTLGTAMAGTLAVRRHATPVSGGSQGLTLPAVLSVVALLINPFHLNSLLSPVTTYAIEYPAMQAQQSLVGPSAAVSFDGRVDYYSALLPTAMRLFDHTQIAGLALLLVAFVVLLMARTTRDLGFLFALGFMTALVIMAVHELPAAAVVAAVVAGVSAQDWYRRSFNMKYTTESRELLFSRGGRAVTVLALAAVAFSVVASRLPGSMPLGFGFDKDTRTTIDTFAEQIKALSPDSRILHTRIEQGDMLIWNGRKSFVDSRIIPFGRPSDPDSIFGKHSNILKMLMLPPAEVPETSDPKEKDLLAKTQQANIDAANSAVNDFKITHAMTRLAPPGPPDYSSMVNLSRPGGWFITSIGPSASILEKVTPATTVEDVRSKTPPFTKMAFQTAELASPGLRQFAAPPTFYEKHVYRSRNFTNANKRLAAHHIFLSGGQPESFEQFLSGLANATLAIRHLNKSLAELPDDAEAFEMLARCYMRLGAMEQLLEQMLGGQQPSGRLKQLRYLQSVTAFRQALVIDPEALIAWDGLFTAYQQMNRLDLASEALEQWLLLVEENPPSNLPEFEEFLTQRYVQQREYRDQIREIEEKFEAALQQHQQQEKAKPGDEARAPDETKEALDTVMQAAMANSGGLARKALQILQDNSTLIRSVPPGSLLLGQLLLEGGDLEEAHRSLAEVKFAAQGQPQAFAGAEWQLPVAVSELVICAYGSAAAIWNTQLVELKRQVSGPELYAGALFSLPMVADVNIAVTDTLPVWPVRNGMAIANAVRNSTEIRAEIVLLMALSRLEEGDLKNAKIQLQSILSEYGATSSRPLATVYYTMMDEDAAKFIEANSTNLWEEYLFPGEKLPVLENSNQNPELLNQSIATPMPTGN